MSDIFAIVSGNHIKILKNAKRVRTLRTLVGHTKLVSSITFSFDFKLLASGSYDNTIKLWKTSNGMLIRTLNGQHTDFIRSVAFSVNGQWLASGSDDKTIKIWKVLDGTLIQTMEGHTQSVWAVAFGVNDTLVASISDDCTLKLWNIDGTIIKTIDNACSRSLAFNCDRKLLAYESDGIKILNVPDGTQKYYLKGSLSDVNIQSIYFSLDSKFLIAGTSIGTIYIWNILDETLVVMINNQTEIDRLLTLTFSLNNEYVIAGFKYKKNKIYNIFNKELQLHYISSDTPSWCIAAPSCLGIMNATLQRKKTLVNGFFCGGNSSLFCLHFSLESFDECLNLL